MNIGRVVFSLDFELAWGHRLSRPSYVNQLQSRKHELRDRVEELIDLFEKYRIPATWAVVGKLVKSGDNELFHAPDLFEYLLDSQIDHEIGLHSFKHKPYNELSQSEARNDLEDGITALQEWGEYPKSFVFPQNKISHLDTLKEAEIRCYRGPPSSMWSSFPRKLLAPETYYKINTTSVPAQIPSSMFLAVQRPNPYRRWYALRGLTKAKRERKIVHYWLHPHNVVTNPSLVPEIETLLEKTHSAENKGEIRVQTMSEITKDLSER